MKNFYPILFLNEDDILAQQAERMRIPKMDELETVTAKDGTVIQMTGRDGLLEEMESAKIAIITDSPLFGPYVNQFIPIYTWYVSTMATDGVRLFVNPKFANSLDWFQKIFVIIHEIMHCVLLHQERGVGYDHRLFNIAGDLEINAAIIDTIDGFNEDPVTKKVDPKIGVAFIKKLEGLYDEKYLGWPAEQIYDEVKKNPGKYPKPPDEPGGGKGKGKGQKIEIAPGMKVRIKKTGEIGIVSKVNSDGTYEVDPIDNTPPDPTKTGSYTSSSGVTMFNKAKNESFYAKLFESYKRDEIIPIMPGSEGGGGGGEPSDEEVEIEEGEPGGSPKDNDPLKKEADKNDVGRCGSIVSKELGEKIAKMSGYPEEEMGKGKDNTEVWRENSKEVLNRISGQKGWSPGGGKGHMLAHILGKLHKGDVDWKKKLARFVGRALSPQTEQRIGNKKYLSNPDYLRYGDKQRFNALNKIIVLVDVSGSMFSQGDKTIKKIIEEINGIIFSKKGKEVIVAFFDHSVDEKSVQIIKAKGGNPVWIPKEIPGGGSTNFQNPLNWVKEKYKDRVSLLIFATDGVAPMPNKPRYYNKFIWLVYDNPHFEQPFGQLISVFTDKNIRE